MIFHQGLLSIKKTELIRLSLGQHNMKFVFDDGEPEINLTISDVANMKIGDVDLDGSQIQTSHAGFDVTLG